ncbi:MAG: lytic transglycosylase domain-containing protein [Brevinema sp.]
MPASHIVERIKGIEGRIQEIQNINRPKVNKTEQTETPKQTEKFSDIMKEVMESQSATTLDLMGEGTNNSPSLGSNLLNNKLDSLMSEYTKNGSMPVATPKPLPKNMINSTNPGLWDDVITRASKEFDVDERLIHAVIQAESAYNPNAVSRAGAQGLMQLMPATAEELGVTDSFSPEQNIIGGTKYLREMLDYYKGDLIKTLAAYNAGPTAVDRSNGIPPYRETREYVPRVLNYYYNLRHQN